MFILVNAVYKNIFFVTVLMPRKLFELKNICYSEHLKLIHKKYRSCTRTRSRLKKIGTTFSCHNYSTNELK